jgi:hypothetical protein
MIVTTKIATAINTNTFAIIFLFYIKFNVIKSKEPVIDITSSR